MTILLDGVSDMYGPSKEVDSVEPCRTQFQEQTTVRDGSQNLTQYNNTSTTRMSTRAHTLNVTREHTQSHVR